MVPTADEVSDVQHEYEATLFPSYAMAIEIAKLRKRVAELEAAVPGLNSSTVGKVLRQEALRIHAGRDSLHLDPDERAALLRLLEKGEGAPAPNQ